MHKLGMPDVKEVVNGLEKSYKYSNVDENNTLVPQWIVLHALALLKAQEPRVIARKEVLALQADAVVWLEDNDKADVIPAIVNRVWKSPPKMVSFTTACMREVKAYMLWYGVEWRCWTSRPDKKKRGETPWDC